MGEDLNQKNKTSPTAAQSKFWGELCEIGCIAQGIGIPAEIHHPLGRTFTFNKVHIGQWFVLALSPESHRLDPINVTTRRKQWCDNFRKSFGDTSLTDLEVEKELFYKQLKRYELYFDKPHPVPEVVVETIRMARR